MTSRDDFANLERIQQQLVSEDELIEQLFLTFDAYGPVAAADRDGLDKASANARARAQDIGEFLEGERPLRIALMGDYSAGKSSFINHLLQDDTLCPVRDDPTTSHVTVFKYGAKEDIMRLSPSGRKTRLTREQYAQLVQSSDRTRRPRQPRRFVIQTPIPALQGIELLDTPGFSTLNDAGDTAATESVLGEIDAILFLVDINIGTIPDSSVERLRRIRARWPELQVRAVFSKCDSKAPGRVQALKEACQREHEALFHGDVLSYSTRRMGQRPDIASREDIARLFHQMDEMRQEVVQQRLTDRIRAHVAQRHIILRHLETLIGAMAKEQKWRAKRAEQSGTWIRERFDRLYADLAPAYQDEVVKALRASFRPEQIPKTGFFFCDARIVRVAPMLPSALCMFRSVCEIRARLKAEVESYIRETTAEAVASVNETCRRAMEDTGQAAEKLMETHFGHLSRVKYDRLKEAQNRLTQALDDHAPAIADQLWDDWSAWIEGLYEILIAEHVTRAVDDAYDRTRTLQTLLEAYRTLVMDDPSPTLELA